jgi:signal transduction histidine kinase
MTSRLLALSAGVLTATGELEVLLGSAADGERIVSAVALPAVTLPLAWSRRAPVRALWAIAAALLLQAALGGALVGDVVTTVVVLAIALYIAGRHVDGARELAGASGAAVLVAATRIAFDPAAQDVRQAVLTLVAVACPLLVGRWARGQRLLQRELSARAARRARDRERDARHAAEEERARIAADLQVAVAGGLRAIANDADTLPDLLRAGDHAAAHERLGRIAGAARSALADVRRVLGVLRHDGEAPRLTPPGATPPAAAPRPAAVAPAAAAVPGATAPAARRAPFAGRAALVDRLLAAAVLAVAATELALVAPGAAWLTAVPLAVPLLWRRRWPLAVAAVLLLAITLQSSLVELDAFPLGNILAMVIATYAIGAYAGRRAAIGGLALVAAGAAAHAAAFYPDGVVAALLGGVVLPWTVGRVVSGNRRLTRAERERAIEVERSRENEARAAVTSERMRVARELHDAVAHNVSVIAIQAGGADGIVERDPERAVQVAALIASVAQEALGELGRLAEHPAAGPAPGLADVDRLVAPARAAGLDVEVHVDAGSHHLPAGLDLAAFRIVQEALANTAKHAGADHAWVTVRFPERAVELEIADDGRGPEGGRPRRAAGRHGLVGMRERVALYGGSLDLGRHASGGFLVRARLPIEGA